MGFQLVNRGKKRDFLKNEPHRSVDRSVNEEYSPMHESIVFIWGFTEEDTTENRKAEPKK